MFLEIALAILKIRKMIPNRMTCRAKLLSAKKTSWKRVKPALPENTYLSRNIPRYRPETHAAIAMMLFKLTRVRFAVLPALKPVLDFQSIAAIPHRGNNDTRPKTRLLSSGGRFGSNGRKESATAAMPRTTMNKIVGRRSSASLRYGITVNTVPQAMTQKAIAW